MGNCDNWRSTVVVVVIVVVAAVVEGHDDGVAGMVGVGATKAKLLETGSHCHFLPNSTCITVTSLSLFPHYGYLCVSI